MAVEDVDAAERVSECDHAPVDAEPSNPRVKDYSCDLLAGCRVPEPRRAVLSFVSGAAIPRAFYPRQSLRSIAAQPRQFAATSALRVECQP